MIQTSLFTFTIRSRIKISPTSTGQTKAVWMNFLTLSSRLATARRDLASNSDKKPKNRRKFAKKIRLKNREIRTNRIKLLLFTFENRRKIKEKSALFGGPYRNSDRQFFYSPQNRGPPPKISPIEQITDRWEPKNSNLQRVTLQCLTSCYRWSNLLRDNVSNLAFASAQNPPKIWKYAWKILIFLLRFLTFWPPFDI